MPRRNGPIVRPKSMMVHIRTPARRGKSPRPQSRIIVDADRRRSRRRTGDPLDGYGRAPRLLGRGAVLRLDLFASRLVAVEPAQERTRNPSVRSPGSVLVEDIEEGIPGFDRFRLFSSQGDVPSLPPLFGAGILERGCPGQRRGPPARDQSINREDGSQVPERRDRPWRLPADGNLPWQAAQIDSGPDDDRRRGGRRLTAVEGRNRVAPCASRSDLAGGRVHNRDQGSAGRATGLLSTARRGAHHGKAFWCDRRE